MTVGAKYCGPAARLCPPVSKRAPLNCVVQQGLHLADGTGRNQWADLAGLGKAIPHPQFGNTCAKALQKTGIHRLVNIKAVDADTGLAGIAELGLDGTLHRSVQISIVKHDEGRIAAQFQRDFLDGAGALRHQQPADWRGAGKAELAYQRMGAELLANGLGIASNDIEHTWRNAGTVGQLGQRQGG